MDTVERTQYLNFLWEFKGLTDVAKIICGVRRCGKSTLMEQMVERLISSGVKKKNIIYMDFESTEFDFITDGEDLKRYFKENLGTEITYVILDEVQRIKDWEIPVNALLAGTGADVYITGSNSKLLSSELSTYITGRYVSIEMLPLSFEEYSELHSDKGLDKYELFDKYIRYGAFPGIDPFAGERAIRALLDGLYASIIYKDAVMRGKILNVAEFERVVRFMMMNIGNPISANGIATSLGNVHKTTVDKYLRLLEQCYILYKAEKYDLKSTVLSHSPKYYSVDVGLRNISLNYGTEDYGRLMENLVYLELIRKGDRVTVGKYGDREVDFSVNTSKGTEYYQVVYSMKEEKVKERELKALNGLRDSYPKTVISTDIIRADLPNGIRHLNIVDFLLGKR
ncbi:MAG: ATP-binding protein [Methanomassiliicoccaceae archaeon]|nr:ATP-binding protein [Methanomassiliicoccaceae archaeon]